LITINTILLRKFMNNPTETKLEDPLVQLINR